MVLRIPQGVSPSHFSPLEESTHPSPSGFHGVRPLLQILSAGFPEIGEEWQSLQNQTLHSLTPNTHRSLRSLLPHQRERIRENLGPEWRAWFVLGERRDPERFLSGLMGLARSLEISETPRALRIYQAAQAWMEASTHPFSSQQFQRIESRIQVLLGQGTLLQRLPFLASRFFHEFWNPVLFGSFVAGMGANQVIRHSAGALLSRQRAVTFLRQGPGRNLAAGFLAYLGEIPAFVGASHLLSYIANGFEWEEPAIPLEGELVSTALFLGGIRFAGLVTAPLIRNLAPSAFLHRSARGAATVLGIYGAQGLQERYGFLPRRDEANRWVDAVDTFFLLTAAGRLAGPWMPRIPSLPEISRSVSPPSTSTEISLRDFLSSLGPRFAWAGIGDVNRVPLRVVRPNLNLAEHQRLYSVATGRSSFEALRPLRETILSGKDPSHVDPILRTVANIPSDISGFHENLIRVMAQLPGRGSLKHYRLALLLENLFKSDGLRTATGSFHEARLQMFVEEAMARPNHQERLAAMGGFFEALSGGIRPQVLDGLLSQFDLGRGWGIPEAVRLPKTFLIRNYIRALRELHAYRTQDWKMIFAFLHRNLSSSPTSVREALRFFGEARRSVRYSNELLDAALDFARSHPQGEFVLRRILQVLAVGDAPAKLAELRSPPNGRESLTHIGRLHREGRSIEEIAEEINGTYHTAYLEDMRLARKVALISVEVAPFLPNGESARLVYRQRFQEFFRGIWETGGRVHASDYIEILEESADPRLRSFVEAYWARRVQLAIIPGWEFDRRIREWGGVSDCNYSFIQSRDGIFQIYLRDLSEPNLRGEGTPQNFGRAFDEFTHRLKLLVHEAEHWRHLSGKYEGPESGAEPLTLGREQESRYTSEVMAYLEEFRWAAERHSPYHWYYAQMTGQNLATLFRNWADLAYFGEGNSEQARQMFPEPRRTNLEENL